MTTEETKAEGFSQLWENAVQDRAAFAHLTRACYEELRAAYLAAGAPYGDTPEGVRRWAVEELCRDRAA